MVTSWHDYPAGIMGRTERSLLEWFEQNVAAGETWVDVGGHYGYTALALSRLVGAGGRVVCFEPVISSAGCIARTRTLNQLGQLTVVPLGLGAAGEMTSIELPVMRGMADKTTELDPEWTERIAVARFDWVWPRLLGESCRIDGIKIDVQGMELDVLTGMVASLAKHRPKLVVEFHRGVDRKEILDLLSEVGYDTAHPFAVELMTIASAGLLDDESYAFLPVSSPRR